MRDSKRPTRKVTNLPKAPPAAIVRTFVLAALAMLACLYAIVYFATRTRPAPPPPAQEVPAPEIVPTD